MFEDLKSGVGVLALIGLFLAAMMIGIDALRTDVVNTISASTKNNESITLDNATWVSLSNNYVVSISQVLVNKTGTWVNLGSNNYTTERENGYQNARVMLVNNAYDGNTSLVTYTYKDDSADTSANITTLGGQGVTNATEQIPTIGILLGVAAIIMVVLGVLWAGKR